MTVQEKPQAKLNQMCQLHNLYHRILTQGKKQFNKRTGAETRVLVGEQLKFDVSEEFPALTTRKLPLKSAIAEMVGFFHGVSSAKDFRELGCKFWDMNANETKAWLENPLRKGVDDVGNIYGVLWNNWESFKFIPASIENNAKIQYLLSKGWIYVSDNYIDCESIGEPGVYTILQRQINQLEEVVRKIMTDPSDRRIIVTGWDPAEYDFQSLPACHCDYKFTPFESDKTMDLVMTMRSSDGYLGIPSNIVTTAVFLYTVCRLTGYKPGTITVQMSNTHLYDNSFEAVALMLGRQHYPLPKLELSDNIKPLKDLSEIDGCFKRIKPSDYAVIGYNSHEAIAPVMMKA